jgi:predicted MPP superfamily phosphohydrolase
LAGDVVDEDIEPVVRLNLGEMLLSLKSKYGTYAIPGNHEYIGGAEKAFAYLTKHNVKLLRDTVVCIDTSFYLAGREDRDRGRFSGNGRKELSRLLTGLDHAKPLILLDHQPFAFQKAVDEGVDLQLSGHTHQGQMWPFNYITQAMYEIDYGYLQKGNTQFYVSSGVGTWGPPVRIGNRPEIVFIHVRFSE